MKALLVEAGIKQKDLAKAAGVTDAFVSYVIAGQRNSLKVRRLIARALGMKLEDLWPNNQRKAA